MTRTPPPGSWCTVVIRLRPLSNGTSAMRGNRVPSAAGLSPALPAAASSAASVGSPTAVQSGCPPAGARSAASLHSAAAVSRPARSGASPACTGRPARVTPPSGPYPVPLISASPAGVHRRRATMFPSVRVPVLSVPSGAPRVWWRLDSPQMLLVWVTVVFHGTAAWRNHGLIIFPLLFYRTSVQLRCPSARLIAGLCPARKSPGAGYLLVGHPRLAPRVPRAGSGRGRGRPAPSHTTGHAGPHPAVRQAVGLRRCQVWLRVSRPRRFQ